MYRNYNLILKIASLPKLIKIICEQKIKIEITNSELLFLSFDPLCIHE